VSRTRVLCDAGSPVWLPALLIVLSPRWIKGYRGDSKRSESLASKAFDVSVFASDACWREMALMHCMQAKDSS
jgi:hypothetical protein